MVWDEFKTEYLIDGGASVLIDRASVKEVDGSTRRSRGVTGLTTGFGFDRSALKAEPVGLIRALFTRARCALM